MHWSQRHDRYLFLAALAFGVLVLPFLVYLTGTYVFGRYAAGGALGFFGDFARGLASFTWHAWALALGPVAIVAIWRALWRLSAPSPPPPPPMRRREPT
jgi:cytochrome b561